ncbi:MAG: 3-deoxy-D-manno-octulosonic-acid transferase [Verrucomicrobiales bacterium]|jgi:3-deoxy-D-manno-octulosonic-acid transferase
MPKSPTSTEPPGCASLVLYNLLLPPGLLLALPGSLLKMRRRGGYGPGFAQRFGRYDNTLPPPPIDRDERPIWMHAVSVGEVLIAQKLISELRQQSPDIPIVLSTTTSTGHAIALKNLSDDVRVIYNPIDLPRIVRRSLDSIRPRGIVLIEAEVWPNLVRAAVRDRIPVLLVNARLSPRSEKRYRQFRKLVAPVFRMLCKVCVQEQEDIERWRELGVSPERICHTGSIKFDQNRNVTAADDQINTFRGMVQQLWGEQPQPMVLLASSHDGEEAAIGKHILTLKQRFPSLKYLVAPRHFERAADVERDLQSAGLVSVRRSQLPASINNSVTPDTLIIDTTGELRAWQALPNLHLVIIGKSFLASGGQNPVEAIAAGKPVIAGPHMENFEALMMLLKKQKGIVQVGGLDALPQEIIRLIDDPAHSAALVDRARGALNAHHMATHKTAQLILAETTFR